ncbi:diguanylate cyclase (GGDEF) domain-containing protein [Malonomonas rubra DSM 5091]|uniref:Diguanylate cyclase (GGDEF) domain-containing protein n=1 Tax=Malonomonas rubra DSM 5091 TaxID=1122189 RepID=A0A1M6FPS4_MALRU|nr:GGDEF domain-containing protein [Malonomonas rubra]SHI99665.1 diguanylate cyclase (GGDEF) domain-containing protein [Malonomonas rubra DSM 5091]
MKTNFFETLSQAKAVLVSLLFLVGIAGLDYLTGSELSFSVFYLIPIYLVTWIFSRRTSYFFCALAAMLWLSIDYLSNKGYSNNLIPLWNTGVRLSFFILFSSLLMELKKRLAIETGLADKDGLTGIYNARAFKKLCSDFLELAVRHRHSVAIGYIDVDDFKTVNDNLGHAEGDKVLKTVANTLNQCIRTTDILGRLGGDEFAVLLMETNEEGAKTMFGRMQKELIQSAADNKWPIGFSIGVAIFPAGVIDVEEAINRADCVMYHIKKSCKNSLQFESIGEVTS